jgi:hypothetical protein
LKRSLPLAAYLATVVAFGMAARLPLAGAATTFVTFLVMAYTGTVLLRRVLPDETSPLTLVVFGSILGLLAGRVGLLAVGLALGLGPGSTVLVMAALLGLGLALRPRQGLLPRWDVDEANELRWLFGILALVLLAMILPFWGEGRLTSQGYAFVPYFNKDFFHHTAITAELARTLPPQNPYFAGEPLHYYWFSHLWPAAVAGTTGIPAREALISTLPLTVSLFVSALVLTVRSYVPARAPRFVAVGLGLFAYSYIGLLVLVKLLMPAVLRLIPNSSSVEYSNLSHGWLRDFFYEPHAITALTMLLLVAYLARASRVQPKWGASLATGLALGTMTATDSFLAVISIIWFGVVNLVPFFREPRRRIHLLATGAMTVALVGCAYALEVLPRGGTPLRLYPHLFTKLAPFYLLVELGPLFVFGTVGVAWALYRHQFRPMAVLGLLLAITLVLAFFVQMPLDHAIALRKAIKVVQVPLVAFAALAFVAYADQRRKSWLRLVGLAVLVPGVVTLGTDVVMHVVGIDAFQPPGNHLVPKTTYVGLSEMRAYQWAREHTPPDAIIQNVSEVQPNRNFGNATGELAIPALSERRTLFCNYETPYLLQVPAQTIQERLAVLERVFTAQRPDNLREALKGLPPHYLFVDEADQGPLEAIRQLEAAGALIEVFRDEQVSLKQFVPGHEAIGQRTTGRD